MPEPIKSARTRVRPGSRTSLPRNVTFVQAVWAKIGPTIDLPRSRMIASPLTNLNPGCATCGLQPLADEFHHADVRAALVALQPRKPPTTTTPASAAVFANVKVFCTSVPSLSPRVFVQVNNARSEERRVGKECRSRGTTYH